MPHKKPHKLTPYGMDMTIRRGTVYYFRHSTSPHPHYFIVVNANPQGDKLLLLTIVTSKVDNLKEMRASHPQSVVEIGPEDYSELSVPSAVDCFKVREESKAELIAKINEQFKRHHDDMPEAIVARIVTAVKGSPGVSNDQRKLL